MIILTFYLWSGNNDMLPKTTGMEVGVKVETPPPIFFKKNSHIFPFFLFFVFFWWGERPSLTRPRFQT